MTTFNRLAGMPADIDRPHVPTRLDADGVRHIIHGQGGVDALTLCGAEGDPDQSWPPQPHFPSTLCPRCLQRHARRVLGLDKTPGWGQ